MKLSTRKTRPGKENEKFNGLYDTYNYSNEEIVTNIRNKVLTPLYSFSENKTPTHNAYCPLCYLYYPKINETKCCHRTICTECIAKFASKPSEASTCPFCRAENYDIIPNLDALHIHEDLSPTEAPKIAETAAPEPDEIFPDEYLAISMQYENTNIVRQLYKAKVSAEDSMRVLQLVDSVNADSNVVIDLLKEGMSVDDITAMLM